MKFPAITPDTISAYHNTDDQFLVAIDLCDVTVTAYDTNRDVRRMVDFVETLLDLGADAAAEYHVDNHFHNSN